MNRHGSTTSTDVSAVPRLVTVWCPHWPVAAARCDPDEPVAVVHANRVLAVSHAATRAGVLVGTRRREAQAACSQVRIVLHDPDRDARRFEPIVHSVATLVPLLEVTEPGLLTFATRGPSRYVGGDDLLATRVEALVLAALGPLSTSPPGIGIADGRFASAIAARRGATRAANGAASGACVIAPGPAATAGFLAPITIAALHDVAGFERGLVDLLHRLGISTLGSLAALPATDLAARFGADGALAHRLAGGGDDTPPDAVAPPPELTVERQYDDPVPQVEPLVFAARQMAEELHDALAGRGTVCTKLLVEAKTEHDEHTTRAWYQPVGMRPAAMVERVRWQLDGWVRQPGGLTGGVSLLRLTPVETRPDVGRQLGFWGGRTDADEWAARTMARVSGLLGVEQVTVPVWHGGRDPARQFATVPAGVVDLEVRTGDVGSPPTDEPWPGHLPAPSPATVLSPPEPCVVEDRAGEVVRVSGRGEASSAPVRMVRGGRAVSIVGWAGPWPVEERWWDPAAGRRRARFQLIDDTGAAYLAAVEGGTWWLDAVYA
jgi:protein ImuB